MFVLWRCIPNLQGDMGKTYEMGSRVVCMSCELCLMVQEVQVLACGSKPISIKLKTEVGLYSGF